MLATILLICSLGLFNLYSSTYDLTISKYFTQQMLWMLLGFVFLAVFVLLDYHIFYRFSYPIYILTVASLFLVLFVGKSSQGSQRWINLAGVTIQPSEIAKVGVVIFLARYFHNHREQKRFGLASLASPLFFTLVPFLLILKQPDLGTGLIVLFTSITMFWFAGIQRKIILITLMGLLITAPITWKYGLKPYQKGRVISFLNPEKDAYGKGYQIIQSKIAIGSGRFSGKGYLQGSQSKLQFLPKQHTDFVFSNFAEEFGFLGSVILFFLYVMLFLMGLNIASTAKEVFGMMLAFGLTASLACQTIINLGMETGLLPVVGMTLPLFSYGGTSLLSTMLALGIILSVSLRRPAYSS
ncbi:MAG: rod shape-determining protein RodA [Bdellovibrionota bacterium]